MAKSLKLGVFSNYQASIFEDCLIINRFFKHNNLPKVVSIILNNAMDIFIVRSIVVRVNFIQRFFIHLL